MLSKWLQRVAERDVCFYVTLHFYTMLTASHENPLKAPGKLKESAPSPLDLCSFLLEVRAANNCGTGGLEKLKKLNEYFIILRFLLTENCIQIMIMCVFNYYNNIFV